MRCQGVLTRWHRTVLPGWSPALSCPERLTDTLARPPLFLWAPHSWPRLEPPTAGAFSAFCMMRWEKPCCSPALPVTGAVKSLRTAQLLTHDLLQLSVQKILIFFFKALRMFSVFTSPRQAPSASFGYTLLLSESWFDRSVLNDIRKKEKHQRQKKTNKLPAFHSQLCK